MIFAVFHIAWDRHLKSTKRGVFVEKPKFVDGLKAVQLVDLIHLSTFSTCNK